MIHISNAWNRKLWNCQAFNLKFYTFERLLETIKICMLYHSKRFKKKPNILKYFGLNWKLFIKAFNLNNFRKFQHNIYFFKIYNHRIQYHAIVHLTISYISLRRSRSEESSMWTAAQFFSTIIIKLMRMISCRSI